MTAVLDLTPELCLQAKRLAAEVLGMTPADAKGLSGLPHVRRPDTLGAEAVRRVCDLTTAADVERQMGLYPGVVWRTVRDARPDYLLLVGKVVRRLRNGPPPTFEFESEPYMPAIDPTLPRRAIEAACAHFRVDPSVVRDAPRGVLRKPIPVAAEVVRLMSKCSATAAELAVGSYSGAIRYAAKNNPKTWAKNVDKVMRLVVDGGVVPPLVQADIIARAVVAAARYYGDDPVAALAARTGNKRRCLTAAVYAIAEVTPLSRTQAGRLLNLDTSSLGPIESRPTRCQEAMRAALAASRPGDPVVPAEEAKAAAAAIVEVEGPAFGEATAALAAEAPTPPAPATCELTAGAKAKLSDALDQAKARVARPAKPAPAPKAAPRPAPKPVRPPEPEAEPRPSARIVGRRLRTQPATPAPQPKAVRTDPPVTMEAFKPGKAKGPIKAFADPEAAILDDAARRKAASFRFDGEVRPDDSKLVHLCNSYGGFPRIVTLEGKTYWLAGQTPWVCSEPKPARAA